MFFRFRSRIICLKLAEVTSLDFSVFIFLDPFFQTRIASNYVCRAPFTPSRRAGSTDVWDIDLLNQWMPIGFYWENNAGITVLTGVKNSGDFLQGATILVADKCHH